MDGQVVDTDDFDDLTAELMIKGYEITEFCIKNKIPFVMRFKHTNRNAWGGGQCLPSYKDFIDMLFELQKWFETTTGGNVSLAIKGEYLKFYLQAQKELPEPKE